MEYEGFFGRASLFIQLPTAPRFDPSFSCRSGYFFFNETLGRQQWLPGECEVDIICNTRSRSGALPCGEGYVCEEGTDAFKSTSVPCPGGFVCAQGTTPDMSLFAPQGMTRLLCQAGFYCPSGTGPSQVLRNQCPQGFFCSSGTGDPLVGLFASDAMVRDLSATLVNPHLNLSLTATVLPGEMHPRFISAQEQLCFDGINEELIAT